MRQRNDGRGRTWGHLGQFKTLARLIRHGRGGLRRPRPPAAVARVACFLLVLTQWANHKADYPMPRSAATNSPVLRHVSATGHRYEANRQQALDVDASIGERPFNQ